MKKLKTRLKFVFNLLLLPLVLSIFISSLSWSAPTGIDIISNTTETPLVAPASELTTAGGTFTTLVLNGTFQNNRWKAYVGNVSGMLSLSDGSSKSIYNWDLAVLSGQVYLSRNDSVQWSSTSCASLPNIESEESFLNKNSSSVDSIQNTFNQTIHRSFFVGSIPISSNSCRAIATNVNDQSQTLTESSSYQEILLQDGSGSLVYTTLLEDSEIGYDGSFFDFQLIVPEDSSSPTPATYYFYAEIN